MEKKPSKCPWCGEMTTLVKHHISYIPENTINICKKCDSRARRTNPQSRGFKIIMTQPPRGLLHLPKDLLGQLGEILEMETAADKIVLLFPYGTPLEILNQGLSLIQEKLKFNIKKEKIIK